MVASERVLETELFGSPDSDENLGCETDDEVLGDVEKVCCSRSFDQSEPEFSGCSSERGSLAIAGCAGCAGVSENLLQMCVCDYDGQLVLSVGTEIMSQTAHEETLGVCMTMGGVNGALEGVIGFLGPDERILVGFDTQAGPSVVDVTVDVESCPVLRKDDFAILGAGGKVTRANTEYDMQVALGYAGEVFGIPVRQIPLGEGKGAELLIGAKEQKGFVESVSVMRSEVKMNRADEEGEGFRRVLVTMPFEELRRRMNGKELTVAAFGDGIATLYIAMMMMGFKIKKYYSVESDPTSRRIVDANVGKVMDRSLGNDVMDIRPGLDNSRKWMQWIFFS